MKALVFRWIPVCMIGFAPLGQAALEWSVQHRELLVHPVQQRVRTSFPFVNSGDAPVEILETEVSCGCLVPTLQQTTYAPGEQGRIDVEFLLQGRTGHQRKEVRVTTSDAPTRPVSLHLSVNIPDGYRLSERRLSWERLPSYEKQVCRLTNDSDQPIHLGEVMPTVDRLDVRLKAVRPGWEYALEVTPHDGVENLRAFIRIGTVPPEGLDTSKDYKVYIFVK